MALHFFDLDGLLRANHYAGFAVGAIARSGYPDAVGIKVKHVFRADLETFTMVLALGGVYFRKVHAKPLVSATGKVGLIDLRWAAPATILL
jgi:hypothetical protein